MNLLGHENFINEHCDAEDLLNQVGSQIEDSSLVTFGTISGLS